MKRILCFLLVLGIFTTVSTNVVGCRQDSINAVDPEEEDERKKEEEDEVKNNLVLKNEYKIFVQNIFQNHINSISSNLFITEESSKKNEYLKYDNLSSYLNNTNETTVKINKEDNIKIKNDLNNIMSINLELKKEINDRIFEEKKFSSLAQGLDSVYSNFEINDSIKIISQLSPDNSLVLNVEFEMSVSFNININSNIENDYTSSIMVYFGIASNDTIVKTISKISRELGQRLYDSNSDLFHFNEEKLKISKGAYKGQNNNVFDFFSTRDNSNLLIEIIDNELKNDNFIKNTRIIFKMNRVEVLDRITLDRAITVKDNGFFENAVMLKNDDATDALKAEQFRDEFSQISVENFSKKAYPNIKRELKVEVEDKKPQLSEYGYLCLESLFVRMEGIEVEINPIHLLYTYKPVLPIEDEIIKVLNQWHQSWNISKSSDPYALFKIKEENDMARKVWKNLQASAANAFARFELADSGYYTEAIRGTQFTKFYLSSTTERRRPYGNSGTRGYGINFSGFGKPVSQNLLRTWQLFIVFDDIKLKVNFVKNPKYVDNFWYGTSRGKLIIERT